MPLHPKVPLTDEERRVKRNAYQKRWRDANLERVHRQEAAWRQANAEKLRAWSKNWRQKNVEKVRAGRRRKKAAYMATHPEQVRAQNATMDLLRRGHVTRPSECEMCGAHCKPEAHHRDYSRPKVITWLCGPCHRAFHKRKNDKEVA